MSSFNGLPLWPDAITAHEFDLIFCEAKYQFEALTRLRDAQLDSNAFKPSAGTSRWDQGPVPDNPDPVNLQKYYRDLWDRATASLSGIDKFGLEEICMVYKTKERVLRFLEFVEGADPDDNTRDLINVIKNFARDTNFEAISSNPNAIEGSSEPLPKALPDDGKSFVITVMPIAFPGSFFESWANNAPLDKTTVENMLNCPSALLLNLKPDLKKKVLQNLEKVGFVANDPTWTHLFDHLCQRTNGLKHVNGRSKVIEEYSKDGYDEQDLAHWIAHWAAYRQMRGNKEVGKRIRNALRNRDLAAGEDGQPGT